MLYSHKLNLKMMQGPNDQLCNQLLESIGLQIESTYTFHSQPKFFKIQPASW